MKLLLIMIVIKFLIGHKIDIKKKLYHKAGEPELKVEPDI